MRTNKCDKNNKSENLIVSDNKGSDEAKTMTMKKIICILMNIVNKTKVNE